MKSFIKSKSVQKRELNKKNVEISKNMIKIKKNEINNSKIKTISLNERKSKEDKENILFKFINSNENIQKIEEIIKKDKKLINKLNKSGLSPLHLSVMIGNINLIKLLLSYKSNINIKSLYNKRTPLHLAYIYNSEKIIKLLLINGANNNELDIYNKKPSDYGIKIGNKNDNIDMKKSGENKLKKIRIKNEKKKEGYKGNIYNLKDSKDNSFVIVTMDNISYLTSDENTINQISDSNITKNNSIINNSKDKDISKDSLENNSLIDSLEISCNKEMKNNHSISKNNKNIENNNIIINNNINLNDSDENLESFYTALITNKRNSFYNSIKSQNKNTTISHYDCTENSTIKNDKNNHKRSTYNSANSTLSQTNQKKNEININYNELNQNCSYLLRWLINIGLSDYYENFLNNQIYDINKLIEQMKSPKNKFSSEDIENILNIHTPGHIYRILTRLEIDGNLINNNIIKFMIGDNNEINKKLTFSDNFECGNWCGINREIKNDLKNFLERNDLNNLYQNFYHNGFDNINYVILQMYSSYPINNDILENCFHIYNENQRILLMEAINKEIYMINNFINSEKYINNTNNDKIKYENVEINVNYINNFGCYIF